MTTVAAIGQFLETLAPVELAESWDAVGLLAGESAGLVARLMTCLTISPRVVEEAVARRADMVVAHHPLPFRPVARLTSASYAGHLLWQLAGARIAIYSPHTAWDSSVAGINQQLAEALQLTEIAPLQAARDPLQGGSGRRGTLREPTSVAELSQRLLPCTRHTMPAFVGDPQTLVREVAIACGSGGSFVELACSARCELLITGEASFHTCVEADARGLKLLLLGHYASERFAMEHLAQRIAAEFTALEVWASEAEYDPLRAA